MIRVMFTETPLGLIQVCNMK